MKIKKTTIYIEWLHGWMRMVHWDWPPHGPTCICVCVVMHLSWVWAGVFSLALLHESNHQNAQIKTKCRLNVEWNGFSNQKITQQTKRVKTNVIYVVFKCELNEIKIKVYIRWNFLNIHFLPFSMAKHVKRYTESSKYSLT